MFIRYITRDYLSLDATEEAALKHLRDEGTIYWDSRVWHYFSNFVIALLICVLQKPRPKEALFRDVCPQRYNALDRSNAKVSLDLLDIDPVDHAIGKSLSQMHHLTRLTTSVLSSESSPTIPSLSTSTLNLKTQNIRTASLEHCLQWREGLEAFFFHRPLAELQPVKGRINVSDYVSTSLI